MKKVIFGLVAAAMLAACNQQDRGAKAANNTTANAANAPAMKFETEIQDFGKIKQGDKVTYEYKFVNSGKSPLIISDAVASCGCTKPEWPHEPIKPGDSGAIKVTFNSAGRSGLQDKQITITANTNPAQNIVHLVGEVTEPAK